MFTSRRSLVTVDLSFFLVCLLEYVKQFLSFSKNGIIFVEEHIDLTLMLDYSFTLMHYDKALPIGGILVKGRNELFNYEHQMEKLPQNWKKKH